MTNMALWTDVHIGFDGDEETVNFGARAVSENEKGIFETCTLATVQPNGRVVKNPRVLAASYVSERVCLAIDTTLIVFKDETCTEKLFVHTFQSAIDCFTVAKEISIIFVVTGKVVECIHYTLDGQILTSSVDLPVENNIDFAAVNIVISTVKDGIYNIFVIGNEGEIFRIKELNLGLLKKEVEENIDAFCKHMSSIEFEISRNPCWGSQIQSSAVIYNSGHVKFMLVGNGIITVWSSDVCESWAMQEPLPRIKSIKSIDNSLLICHSVDGNLYTMCLHTFMYLSTWDEMPVEDLIVLNEESVTEQTYLLLLSNLNEDDKRCIQLVAFPSFEKIFNISVSPSTFLVSMMSYSQEVLFVEGSKNSNLEFIQSFCIKNITESQPLERLQRLLRRRKFEEAENFAKIFSLNVEIVFKEEVKHYMELLQPWSVSRGEGVDAANLNKFIELLSKIHDIEFVCEVCMNVVTTDLTKTQQVLDYARDRLKKEDNKNLNSRKISILQSSLWNLSLRLDTFLLVYESYGTDLEWCKFSRADLMNVCKQHIQRGEINKAVLIWAKHWYNYKSRLTEETILELLNAIPLDLKPVDLLPWLFHFISSVLSTVPKLMNQIISWIIRAIKTMEIDWRSWPDSGLNFAKEILQIAKVHQDSRIDNCSIYKWQSATNVYLKELVNLIDILHDLKQLKDKHKIRVTLADFTQDNKNEVTRILLGKVAPMNIKLLMTDFLNNFMFKNGLVAHVVLSKCIHGILNCSENWWYHNEQAPWEETVAAVIPCISNIEEQIKCIISVLKMAPVPWSEIMKKIANKGLQLDHPLVKLIRHEYKMMEIKIVQKKYGLTKLSVENCNLYSLIRAIKLIFKAGQEGMLEDALKFASISTKMTEEAYILCIEHYLEMGNQRKALELLDSLKPDMFVKSCERLVFRAQSFLQSKRQIDVSNAYFEILDSLATRAKKFSLTKDKNSPIIDLPIEEIRNIYLIYKQFGKRISLKDYCWDHSRLKVLSECAEELIESDGDIFDIYYNVAHISRLLQFPPYEGILEMIKHSLKKKNMTLTLNIMRNLFHCHPLPKSASDRLREMVSDCLHLSCSISNANAGPEQAYDIARGACTYWTDDSFFYWLDLLSWTRSVQYLTAQGGENDGDGLNVFQTAAQENLKRWRFTPLYTDPFIFSNSNRVMRFLKDVCGLFANSNSLNEVVSIKAQLVHVSKHLKEIQHDVGGVRLWCSLASWASTQSQELSLRIEPVACDSVKALLLKVVSARQLDIDLGLGLLHFLNNAMAKDCLDEMLEIFKEDYQKLSNVAELAVLFLKYEGCHVNKFQTIFTRCKWAKKFGQLKIHCKDIFVNSPDQKINLLKEMMHLKQVDIFMILEYCFDFELDPQDCLKLYLRILLTDWEPSFEIEKSVDGEQLHVQEVDSETDKKCNDILKLIKNKDELIIELNQIVADVNYYYYEMFIYIISLLEKLLPNENFMSKKVLLLFLKKYKRVENPKQQELAKWHHKFPNASRSPVLSKWRVPFSVFLMKEPWVVLKEELRLNTYKQWLTVSNTLNIHTDAICSTTIQESINSRYNSNVETPTEAWNVHSQDSLFLSQIEECVKLISDLKMASACMHLVMNNAPPGADQVKAADLCYKYTLEWSQTTEEPYASEYIKRIHKKYLDLKTTHILHKYGLGEASYLGLVAKPRDLMLALCQDPSIISRMKGYTLHCPDINAAIEDIAEVHKIKSISFRLDQLIKWLRPSTTPVQQSIMDDETCDLTRLINLPNNNASIEEDNLLRVYYLLKCDDEKSLASYLVNLAFKLDTNVNIPMESQLRALQCLLTLISDDALEDLTGKTTEEIGEIMKNLTYARTLEMLGFNYSVSNFENFNKLELVKSIWTARSNNQQALVLMSRLCLEYGIRLPVIWEALLKEMVKLSMVAELEVLLLHLANLGHMLNSTQIVSAWELVLFAPFTRRKDEEACIHSLVLIQSCPVLRSINMEVIIEHSLQMVYPHLAAVLLLFLNEEERNIQKQKILKMMDKLEIIQKLKHLISKGVSIAEKAISFLESDGNPKVNGCP